MLSSCSKFGYQQTAPLLFTLDAPEINLRLTAAEARASKGTTPLPRRPLMIVIS
jgi:hypothetical protein